MAWRKARRSQHRPVQGSESLVQDPGNVRQFVQVVVHPGSSSSPVRTLEDPRPASTHCPGRGIGQRVGIAVTPQCMNIVDRALWARAWLLAANSRRRMWASGAPITQLREWFAQQERGTRTAPRRCLGPDPGCQLAHLGEAPTPHGAREATTHNNVSSTSRARASRPEVPSACGQLYRLATRSSGTIPASARSPAPRRRHVRRPAHRRPRGDWRRPLPRLHPPLDQETGMPEQHIQAEGMSVGDFVASPRSVAAQVAGTRHPQNSRSSTPRRNQVDRWRTEVGDRRPVPELPQPAPRAVSSAGRKRLEMLANLKTGASCFR